MNKLSRKIIFFGSLILISVFFFPLWDIDLEAPQYPEGLSMSIWYNRISGDLNIINGLNHYIGMKQINPKSIPELKYMAFIISFLIVFGFIVSYVGKKWLLGIFVSIFLAICFIGAYDFYLWGYDYGHNLDPTAAIKVPGMTYQPPLWGSKQLLNFIAHSYPSIGGWILIIIATVFVFVFLFTFIKKDKFSFLFLFACLFLALQSCEKPTPKSITVGETSCEHCQMLIMEKKFVVQALNEHGKISIYDDLICFINVQAYDKNPKKPKLFVANFFEPDEFFEVEESVIWESPMLNSPMGGNMAFLKNKTYIDSIVNVFPGKLVDEDFKKTIFNPKQIK